MRPTYFNSNCDNQLDMAFMMMATINANSVFDDVPKPRLSLRERMAMKQALEAGNAKAVSKPVTMVTSSQSVSSNSTSHEFGAKNRNSVTIEPVTISLQSSQNSAGVVEVSINGAGTKTSTGGQEGHEDASTHRRFRRAKDGAIDSEVQEQTKSSGACEVEDTTSRRLRRLDDAASNAGGEGIDEDASTRRRFGRRAKDGVDDEVQDLAKSRRAFEVNDTKPQRLRGADDEEGSSGPGRRRTRDERSDNPHGRASDDRKSNDKTLDVVNKTSIENLRSIHDRKLERPTEKSKDRNDSKQLSSGKQDENGRRGKAAQMSAVVDSSRPEKSRKESALFSVEIQRSDVEPEKFEAASKVGVAESMATSTGKAKPGQPPQQGPAVKEKPRGKTQSNAPTESDDGQVRRLPDATRKSADPLSKHASPSAIEDGEADATDTLLTLNIACPLHLNTELNVAQVTFKLDSQDSETMRVVTKSSDFAGLSVQGKILPKVKKNGDPVEAELKVANKHARDIAKGKEQVDDVKKARISACQENGHECGESLIGNKDFSGNVKTNYQQTMENEEEIRPIEETLVERSSAMFTDEIPGWESNTEPTKLKTEATLRTDLPSSVERNSDHLKNDVKTLGKVDLKSKTDSPGGINGKKVGPGSGKFDFKSQLKSTDRSSAANASDAQSKSNAKLSSAPSKLDTWKKAPDQEKAVAPKSKFEAKDPVSGRTELNSQIENKTSLFRNNVSDRNTINNDKPSKKSNGEATESNTESNRELQYQSISIPSQENLQYMALEDDNSVEVICVGSVEAKAETVLAKNSVQDSAEKGKAKQEFEITPSKARAKFEIPSSGGRFNQESGRDHETPTRKDQLVAPSTREKSETSSVRNKFEGSKMKGKVEAAGSSETFKTSGLAEKNDSTKTTERAAAGSKQPRSDLLSSKKAEKQAMTATPRPVFTAPAFQVAVDEAVEECGTKAVSMTSTTGQHGSEITEIVTIAASTKDNPDRSTEVTKKTKTVAISKGELKETIEEVTVTITDTSKVYAKSGNNVSESKASSGTKASGGQSIEAMMREKKRKEGMEKKVPQQAKSKNAFKAQLEANSPKPQPGQNQVQSQGDSNIEKLLKWVAKRVNQYPCVHVTNFTTSWSDGIAFCALLNYLLGNEAIPPEEVSGDDRRKNFELAFSVAERHGVPALLDVNDMCRACDPDRRSVITYVHLIYKILFADKQTPK